MLCDPRITKPLARLMVALEAAETLNDPLTRSTDTPSRGKPGSRPPGRTQCDWVVREMERILDRALTDATRALNNARIREHTSGEVTTVGGVPVSARETRIKGHLVAKARANGVRIEVSDG